MKKKTSLLNSSRLEEEKYSTQNISVFDIEGNNNTTENVFNKINEEFSQRGSKSLMRHTTVGKSPIELQINTNQSTPG